jgi:SAM-dependent methyltransferase
MDFVAGSRTTKLDDLDYDAFYGVSPERADRDFATVKRLLGERLPASLGSAIEVGCGTGGFTVGALRGLALENAVLTDISPRMLRRCRRRLQEVGVLGRQNTVFATYSGNEDCFAEAAYDCCFGAAVVHHILDVEGFFRSVARWLKPGGRAFFVEPGARCHWALVLTTADVAAILLARDADPDVVARLLNWTAEVRYNLVHAGDLALLERREDKHLFSKEQVAALAGAAGFARSAAIPFGVADHGRVALTEYLGQHGFTGATLAELLDIAATVAPPYFDLLDPADAAPSCVIYLEKSVDGGEAAPPAPAPAPTVPEPRPMNPAPRAHLRASWRDGRLAVDGWVCSPLAVRRLVVEAGGREHLGAVWRPRPDVHKVINGSRLFPPIHALCSGVEESFELDRSPGGVRVTVETAQGHRLALGGMVLPTRSELAV